MNNSWKIKKREFINDILVIEYKCPFCGSCETTVNNNAPSGKCYVCERAVERPIELKEVS